MPIKTGLPPRISGSERMTDFPHEHAARNRSRHPDSELKREEIEALRAWIDGYLEDQLELTDEVKRHLDQSRQEIAAGEFTSRQP